MQQRNTPKSRYSHTLVSYEKKLYVFGGAGNYIPQIKMRLGFNDL